MIRCLKCGCSRLDPKGYKCARCGGAPGFRSEQCYVTEGTKAKLLAHADDLKAFGVTLEEHKIIQKSAGDLFAGVALALQIAESLKPGILRELLQYLRDISIPQDEILRLRLDEPEQVLDLLKVERDEDRP